MGCDIYTFVEIKTNAIKQGSIHKKWYPFDVIDVGRNYNLFGLLAGVRSITYMPLIKPKGIPNDLSIILKDYYNCLKPNIFGESWFSRNELKKIIKKIHTINKKLDPEEKLYFISDRYYNFLEKLILKNKIKDYRIIIWFDN